MDIITTSLEALIQRATSVQNQGPDTAAIEAFCGLVRREPQCTQAASRLIIAKAHSLKEWEALQALLVLENCMRKCGGCFESEVEKFRFLNELIKLVSPKYLGAHTPDSVKRRVLELLAAWAREYPAQGKIRDAYTMLAKQGVVQPELAPPPAPAPPPPPPAEPRSSSSSIFQDEEKSLLLQKLLRSSNPVDLQAANRLIKTMVKEDEKRVEEKWRRRGELETVVNNCLLLGEMLSCYERGRSSPQDLELITELHTTCTNLRPVLARLANSAADPSFTCDVLSANDELGEVLSKYKEVMSSGAAQQTSQQSSLLDLTSPEQSAPPPLPVNSLPGTGVDLLGDAMRGSPGLGRPGAEASTNLADILSLVPGPPQAPQLSTLPSTIPQPSQTDKTADVVPNTKPSGLEELDLLGENMLKEILSNSGQHHMSKRVSGKVCMNDLVLNGGDKGRIASEADEALDRLSPAMSNDSGYAPSNTAAHQAANLSRQDDPLLSLDCELESLCLGDSLAGRQSDPTVGSLCLPPEPDLLMNKPSQVHPDTSSEVIVNQPSEIVTDRLSEGDDVNLLGSPSVHPSPQMPASLADISLSIDAIRPSGVPPWTALADPDGLNVVITLASDRPRPDVSVFVITTSSKSKSPLTDVQLQPIVPKRCKARLLPPSSTVLPPSNPFLPPSALVQILLVASTTKDPITLKLVINYMMDEEGVTDMGQVDGLCLAE